MSNCDDDDRTGLFIEDNAPITDSQPRTLTTFEPFYVTFSARGKLRQTNINTSADLRS
jgi:hypothetical protein